MFEYPPKRGKDFFKGIHMKEEDLLLSIVVLDIKNNYLLPITLNSILRQSDQHFEVLILTQNVVFQELNRLRKSYSNLSFIEIPSDVQANMLKNIALKKARGKYVHFLFPGEYYLSEFSLKFIFDEIKSEDFPDIICFSDLHRDIDSPSKIFFPALPGSSQRKKYYSIPIRDVFFLRETVNIEGGFDVRYFRLQGFALITKISLNKSYKILSLRRVIVDYELQKDDPQKFIGYLPDLISIIYKYYGFRSLFCSSVIKEILEVFSSWLKRFKIFFIRSE